MKMNDNESEEFTLNIIMNNDSSIHGEIKHCKSDQRKIGGAHV